MDDTDIVEFEHVAPLHEDKIPDANQSHNCFSCGEDMTGVYCYACGNKNDNYRRSIWSLGLELFSSLTAFEGRIWRSLRSLIFKPGQMAREFSDGARQKWTSPIRLFLATSLLLFGYIAISQTQLIAFGPEKSLNSPLELSTTKIDFTPQVFFLERKNKIRDMITDDRIAEFENNIGNIVDQSLAELDDEIESQNQSIAEGIAIQDIDEGSDIRIVDRQGNEFQLGPDGLKQASAIAMREPDRINGPINKYLSRIMVFMMPFSMLMGAIFIRGKERAMLYDHLVHAAYIHAFAFLLLFVFILLVQFTPIKGLIWLYAAILLIYLPISAKSMFNRGWFKTLLTSYGVGVIYTFTMVIILIALIIMGFLDIAKDVAQTRG